jgi:endonuclease G, mitochondrial
MMSSLLERIDKARLRGGRIDLRTLAAHTRDKAPVDLDDPDHLRLRMQFLRESLGDAETSRKFYERIIHGNELQDVSYLARGTRAARAVGRIAVRAPDGRQKAWGTGFLIAPNLLLTNHHILPDIQSALRSEAHFEYELNVEGEACGPTIFRLDAARLFFAHEPLDFAVVAVQGRAENGDTALSAYGHLPLVGALGKASEGEWLTIVQHPRGERKQLCIRENQLIRRDTDVLWYSTDTLGGSSGSPVFNNDWYVVALHHSGVPDERDGRMRTIDGQVFDPGRHKEEDIRWIANEGIRVSRIVDTLRESAVADDPLLTSVFASTPQSARIGEAPREVLQALVGNRHALGELSSADSDRSRRIAEHPKTTHSTHAGIAMIRSDTTHDVTVTLRIGADGDVRVLDSDQRPYEQAAAYEAARSRARSKPGFDVPFQADYSDREGYRREFLDERDGNATVFLPKLSAALEKRVARLIDRDLSDSANEYVLKYHNFSLTMDARRRFAIYTAANVDFGSRYNMGRPNDVWRVDPRIELEHQVSGFYYANNQFDRGHLVRREDLEFGPTRLAALQSAADTCHFTNCAPQHSRFNQNRELWQGIERHILEDSIQKRQFRAQVFTGPVLEESDPVWKKFDKIQYPLRFWKVVAALTDDGKLFATAYLLDQSEAIDRYGIEAEEIPFGPFKTFQVPITAIEALTGLSFACGDPQKPASLSEKDPLARKKPRRRDAPFARRESARIERNPYFEQGYLLLESFDDIELP